MSTQQEQLSEYELKELRTIWRNQVEACRHHIDGLFRPDVNCEKEKRTLMEAVFAKLGRHDPRYLRFGLGEVV